MIIVLLFALFESGLFPENFFTEDQFNPALIRNKPAVLSFCAGTRFSMSELREYEIYLQSGSYSIGLNSLGSELYRENDLNGSFNVLIYDLISAGLGLHVLNCWISGNSNRFNYSLRAGSAGQLGPLLLSGWINNIKQLRFSSGDRLPVTYSVRADYTLENRIVFSLAVRSIAGNLLFYNTGIKSRFFNLVEIGFGLNTDPVLIEFVGCFRLGRLSLVYQGSSHYDLGLSHTFGAMFQL